MVECWVEFGTKIIYFVNRSYERPTDIVYWPCQLTGSTSCSEIFRLFQISLFIFIAGMSPCSFDVLACSPGLLSSCIIVTIAADVVIIVVVVSLRSICGNGIVIRLALALVVLCVGRPHGVASLSESASDWRIRHARTPTSKRCRTRCRVALFDIRG